MDGQQIANYEAQNFGQLPIDRVMDANGQPLVVDVPYLDYYVHANVWRVNVGRISLYLLDTDNEMNSEFDRPITHQLYGGDWENRLKQEILLGIGGILTLKALGISLSSWFALLLFIQFILRFLPVTTTSTKVCSVSTWVVILLEWVSAGTT